MNTATTKFLNRNPLFIWALSFILGVLTALFLASSIQILVIAILLILIILKGVLRQLNTEFITLVGFFLVLGLFLTEIRKPKPDVQDTNQVELVEVLETKKGRGLWDQAIITFQSEKSFLKSKYLLYLERGSIELAVGDKVALKTNFERIQNRNNPGEFNAESYWKSKGINYVGFVKNDSYLLVDTDNQTWFERIIARINMYSSDVLDQNLPQESKGLMKAMILGDRTELDPELKESFVHAGAMHVLAVSGLHVGLIAYFLSFILKQFLFRRKPRCAVLITIVLLWIYAAITGFSPSVLRSVLMFSFLIGGQAFGRITSSLNTLCFAALIILAYDPFLLLDLGFQLSFLAMFGIFTVYPILVSFVHTDIKLIEWLWKGSVVGIAAQVMTFPIALYHFHQFANYFLFSNILVMLFATILLGFGILLLVLGKLSFIASGVGSLLSWSIFLFVQGIIQIDFIPGSVAYGFSPNIWWVAFIYTVIIIVIIKVYLDKRLIIELSLIAFLMVVLQIQRYQHYTVKELVVFNYTDPVLLLNNGGNQICFYKAPESHRLKIEALINDYQKVYPGSVKMVDLANSMHKIDNKFFQLSLIDKGSTIDFSLNEKNYSILRDLKSFKKEESINYIALPRLQASGLWSHFLESGALRIQL